MAEYPDLACAAEDEMAKINELLNSETAKNEPNMHQQQLQLIENEVDDELVAMAVPETVKVTVAMDSGSVANVIHPNGLPAGTTPSGNEEDTHFSGAGGDRIRRYGHCKTMLQSPCGQVGCRWEVADVTRPLHAVSQVTGPEEHPVGLQDVLFNNKRCVVVPPGVVERIIKELAAQKIHPVAEYGRKGGLYLAEMQMSRFTRQGANP